MHDFSVDVSARTLSRDAEWLIQDCIGSVEALETLLLLRSRPDRAWTPEELADELRSNAASAARWLRVFNLHGLVSRDGGSYRYAPEPGRRSNAVDALSEEYAERRYSVIDRILSRPASAIRDLAEAFRIRPEEEP